MIKGQVVTVDLIFALILALAVIVVINAQWGIMLTSAENSELRISAERSAYSAMLSLVNNGGYPADWNSTNAVVVGLGQDRKGVIDGWKFIQLMEIDNDTLGEKIGVPEYKIHINLTSAHGAAINSTGIVPDEPSVSARVMSFVSFNGELSRIYVTVWK